VAAGLILEGHLEAFGHTSLDQSILSLSHRGPR
jgi:hypothetical protein